MRSSDPYLSERMMAMHVAEERRLAEIQRLARLARPAQQEGALLQGRWLLCQVGYWLVAIGAWLDAFSARPYGPARPEPDDRR